MTQPPVQPLPYETPPPPSADAEHLRLLALFHYIWGGIIALFSSIAIIHVVLGVIMLTNPAFFGGSGGSQPPPRAVGWVFVIAGGSAITLGWTWGGLTIVSGRCLAKRRRRTFSMVIASINCLSIPFGTLLGVFTLIVLSRASVLALYRDSWGRGARS